MEIKRDVRFRIALSFPGEWRPFVSQVAAHLAKAIGREHVFYDKYYEAELARPDLDTYLQSIYHDSSELVAVFLCKEYQNKKWCGLEWRALRDLIANRQASAIMPFRFDDTHISGLFSIDGYIAVADRPPEEIAAKILERLSGGVCVEQKEHDLIDRPTLKASFPFMADVAASFPGDGPPVQDLDARYFLADGERLFSYRSPAFVPLSNPLARAATLDEIFIQTLQQGESSLFAVITHFAPDAREALLSLAVRADTLAASADISFDKVQWLAVGRLLNEPHRTLDTPHEFGFLELLGPSLFRHFHADAGSAETALAELRARPPSLFLIDASELSLSALSSAAAADSAAATVAALRKLALLCTCSGHRFALALPRFGLALPAFRDLAYELAPANACFLADELFSITREYRRDRCLTILGGTPLPHGFDQLLYANSNLWIYRLAWLLRRQASQTAQGASLSTRAWMNAAALLAQDGFFEIAYRIELACRTCEPITHSNRPIRLVADLKPLQRRLETVGFLSGLDDLPSFVTRGVVTGSGGSGKTVALFEIQRRWALPRVERRGLRHPAWMPIYLQAMRCSPASPDVFAFPHHEIMRTGNSRESYRLQAHGRIAPFLTLDRLQWIFSSRVMLLLDGVDALSRQEQVAAEERLKSAMTADPGMGMLAACRRASGLSLPLESMIAIRALNETQVREFVGTRLESSPSRQAAVLKLLDVIDRPVSRLLRNPYLLERICRIDNLSLLGDFNLYELIAADVESSLRDHAEEGLARIVYQWLPQVALAEKRGLESNQPDGPATLDNARQAHQAGFLRGPDLPVRFQHDLLRDFFAARGLGLEFARVGSACLSECISLPELSEEWEYVLRMLLGYLNHDRASREATLGKCLEFMQGHAPRLAQRCLLELTPADVQGIPACRALPELMVRRIDAARNDFEDALRESWPDADAMGFWDPRIAGAQVMDGFVGIDTHGAIKPFRAGRFPVTNLEFSRFISDGAYIGDSRAQAWWHPRVWDRLFADGGALAESPGRSRHMTQTKANYPVVGVSLYEALAYCRWLGEVVTEQTGETHVFTLPTEDQWAFIVGLTLPDLLQQARACRRTIPSRGWVGDARSVYRVARSTLAPDLAELPPEMVTFLEQIREFLDPYRPQLRFDATTPVGLFQPAPSRCFDVLGNVWEWCDAWHQHGESDRPSIFDGDPTQPAVVMGGPVGSQFTDDWVVSGGWFDPCTYFEKIGFRVCCTSAGKL
jgi:hypothetical protein